MAAAARVCVLLLSCLCECVADALTQTRKCSDFSGEQAHRFIIKVSSAGSPPPRALACTLCAVLNDLLQLLEADRLFSISPTSDSQSPPLRPCTL